MATSHCEVNQAHYADKASAFGVGDVRSLSWGSRTSQEVRFKQITRLIDPAGLSVLDVGCGFGDLYHWLCEQGQAPASYLGVDICPHNIEFARGSLPADCQLLQGDFLALPVPEVDLAILSGTLNLDFDDWENISRGIIAKMWSLSRRGVIFNLESAWGLPPHKLARLKRDLDPLKWIDFARGLSDRLVFLHDYHDCDFTLGLFRHA